MAKKARAKLAYLVALKLAKALISFADNSFLFVYLSKKTDPVDNVVFCSSIIGLPNGAPIDKPSIALSIQKLQTINTVEEILIPMSRINGISILEEYPQTSIKSDIQKMWE